MNEDKVVLFDGVCNFCNSSVQFILKHDKSKSLKFASLQSTFGQRMIAEHHISSNVDSVIFIENGKAYIKSEAALRIANYFGGGWKLLRAFVIVPKFIRNFFYDVVARNRYRWFGKRDACMIPSPEMQSRFLDL